MKFSNYILLLIALPTLTFANTCPTNLMQDHKGYWLSHEAPGWQSATTTPPKITINVQDFGGAHYSPLQHRLVCVYRQSDGRWLALVSHKTTSLKIDRQALASDGKSLAWQEDKSHQDFTCAHHQIIERTDCKFSL